jgi:hypothetical protein
MILADDRTEGCRPTLWCLPSPRLPIHCTLNKRGNPTQSGNSTQEDTLVDESGDTQVWILRGGYPITV